MAERIKPTPSPEVTAEEYCEHLRGTVEIALQKYFGKLADGCLNKFADKVSTSPAKVQQGVNEESLSNQCYLFSSELQQCLGLTGLDTKLAIADTPAPVHYYLTTQNAPHDVIIDPTIGQFVIGHNHVFVGTRQQLIDLVLSQTGHESPYKLRGDGSNHPYLLFEAVWGSRSKPISDSTDTNCTDKTLTALIDKPEYSGPIITDNEFKLINKETLYPPKEIVLKFIYKK